MLAPAATTDRKKLRRLVASGKGLGHWGFPSGLSLRQCGYNGTTEAIPVKRKVVLHGHVTTDKIQLKVYVRSPDMLDALKRAAKDDARSVSVLTDLGCNGVASAHGYLPKDGEAEPTNGENRKRPKYRGRGDQEPIPSKCGRKRRHRRSRRVS